jgi:hypothetical protein
MQKWSMSRDLAVRAFLNERRYALHEGGRTIEILCARMNPERKKPFSTSAEQKSAKDQKSIAAC